MDGIRFAEKRARQTELTAERQVALQELSDLRRRKSRLVEDAARALTTAVGARVRVATVPMGDAEGTRASVVVSGGQLFLRTTQALYCVGK